MDQEQYEQDLKRRQLEHLKNIGQLNYPIGLNVDIQKAPWQPCLHDSCQKCHGTGVSIDGMCIHFIHCTCPKCSPTFC